MNILTGTSNILTVDNLTRAIQNSVGRKGIGRGEAQRMAEHMLNFFGYNDRIIDNILEPEDRDVFYMMEDSGLMTTEREETTLYDGREWRINYWLFKRDKIVELMDCPEERCEERIDEYEFYGEIPDEIWNRSE